MKQLLCVAFIALNFVIIHAMVVNLFIITTNYNNFTNKNIKCNIRSKTDALSINHRLRFRF